MTRPRIEDWSKPEKLVLIQGWRRDGLTVEQVADNIGIVKSTLYEWMKKNSNISNALKIGAEESLMVIENALYNLARKGNLGAIIFYLKNRGNGKWQDKVHNHNVNETYENNLSEFLKEENE